MQRTCGLQLIVLLWILLTLSESAVYACDDLAKKRQKTEQDLKIEALKETLTHRLSDLESEKLLGVTEQLLVELDVPHAITLDYYFLNEAIAFLWDTPLNYPAKKRMFEQLARFLKNSRLADNDNFKLSNAADARDLPFDKQLEAAYRRGLREIPYVRDIFDPGLEVSRQFGDLFVDAFFPFREDFILIRVAKPKWVSAKEKRQRLVDYFRDHAVEDEIKATIKFLGRFDLRGRPSAASFSKSKLDSLYKKIIHVQSTQKDVPGDFREFFLTRIQREISMIELRTATMLMQPFNNFAMHQELKSEIKKQLNYPTKAASLLASLILYGKTGNVPKEWDRKNLTTTLTQSLKHLVGQFRRSVRPYQLTEEAVRTAVDPIKQPVFYAVTLKNSPVEPPPPNPKKRKNQSKPLVDDVPEVRPQHHIPVIASPDVPIVLWPLLPYSNRLKKQMKKLLSTKIVNLFHDVYLPKIRENPKQAGKMLHAQFPKNWYRIAFKFEGKPYRVAYRLVDGAVDIISIGYRGDHFYEHLEAIAKEGHH